MKIPNTRWARTLLAHQHPDAGTVRIENGMEVVNGGAHLNLWMVAAIATASCEIKGPKSSAAKAIRSVLRSVGLTPAAIEETISALTGADTPRKWQAVRLVQRHWIEATAEAFRCLFPGEG